MMRSNGAIGTPHIAHVLPWRNIGGTEIATQRLIEAAATHGISATVLYRPGADPVRDMFVRGGITVAEYAAPMPSYRAARAYIAASRELARQLLDLGADAVHCADVAAAFQVALAGRLARIPVISHVRNRYRFFPLRLRPVLGLVDHFAFVSRQTWSEFGHRVAPARGTVLYDGVAVPQALPAGSSQRLRAELGIPDAARVVGMVARVARQKDIETLVRAARRVIDTVSDVHFVVVGDNATAGHREYYHEVATLVAQLGMANRFVFTGHRSDVQALLSMMDVFVLSTHWEGFPLVILEAMAAGLPVVATAVDGIPEVVVSGETGFLVPHSAPEPLAGSLLRLLREPDLLSRMGSAARAHVSAQFGQEQFRRAVGTLYDRMLPAQRLHQLAS